jgi:hypothetical protein
LLNICMAKTLRPAVRDRLTQRLVWNGVLDICKAPRNVGKGKAYVLFWNPRYLHGLFA